MLYSCFVVLSVAHVLPWIMKPGGALSDPSKLTALLSGLVTLPYFGLVVFGYRSSVIRQLETTDIEGLVTEFALLYSLAMLFLYMGINSGRRLKLSVPPVSPNFSLREILVVVAVLLAIFFYATVEKLAHVGGVAYLIENLARRAELVAGVGVLGVLIEPSAFLAAFLLIYCRGRFGAPSTLMVILVVSAIFVGLAVFGGRKLPMFLVLFSAMAFHFYVRPLKILSWQSFCIGLAVAFFFVWMLRLRSGVGSIDPVAGSFLVEAIENSSYIDTYLFVLDYFNAREFWYGAAFGDLLIRLGISSLSDLRVPIDDGVYLRTLFQGWTVFPPAHFDDMFPSSWPPESFGNGYLNFGVPGVLVFFFIRGLVIGGLFGALKSSEYSPAMFFLYLFVVFNFHFTNLRLVQLFFVAIPVLLVVFVISRRRRVELR